MDNGSRPRTLSPLTFAGNSPLPCLTGVFWGEHAPTYVHVSNAEMGTECGTKKYMRAGDRKLHACIEVMALLAKSIYCMICKRAKDPLSPGPLTACSGQNYM